MLYTGFKNILKLLKFEVSEHQRLVENWKDINIFVEQML